MDSRLTLPYTHGLDKNLIIAGSFAKDNGFARLACNSSQRPCRRAGTNKGFRMDRKLLHTSLVAQNTALATLTTGVNGQHGQLSSILFEDMKSENIDRRTLASTWHTTDTDTDRITRVGKTLLDNLLRHGLMLRLYTLDQSHGLT